MVIYGDSVLSVDFGRLLAFHEEVRKLGSRGTILYHRPGDLILQRSDGTTYYGVLSINENGRITKFREKPQVTEICPGFDLANAAVFVLEREMLMTDLTQQAQDFSFDVFEPAINRELIPFYAIDIGQGFRYDVGNIARFYEANIKTLRQEWNLEIPANGNCGVWRGEDSYSEKTLLIPPVLLGARARAAEDTAIGPDVIIGTDCIVERGARIRKAIVMRGCKIGADARLEDCIVGADSEIKPHSEITGHSVIADCTVIGADLNASGSRLQWP